MKILHLFSNWKWTGPAEHALNLAVMLQKRGHDVTFACAAPPADAPDSLAACARRAGIAPVTRFAMNKHFKLTDNLKDIPALRAFVRQERFDLVHTHLPNDHFLAGMALSPVFRKVPIVRTCYDGDGVAGGFRTRVALSRMTNALITISERTRQHVIGSCGLPENRVWKIDSAVDLARFDPQTVRSNRASYNLSDQAVVGGIVARVQRHRRFDVLLEAIQIVLNEFPNMKFMIIGRGTHIEEIAIKPSQVMGIRTNLIFTGYKKQDFAQTLACLNFKVFLMPGSDGSCRAVREAMAMNIPVIAANRGMLPEIISHGTDGLVIDDTPEKLARAMLLLIEHPGFREQMGHAAGEKARKQYSPEFQARQVEAVYAAASIRRTKGGRKR